MGFGNNTLSNSRGDENSRSFLCFFLFTLNPQSVFYPTRTEPFLSCLRFVGSWLCILLLKKYRKKQISCVARTRGISKMKTSDLQSKGSVDFKQRPKQS